MGAHRGGDASFWASTARIRALVDLPDRRVKKGETGGWVSDSAEISGSAWVYDEARVYGSARVLLG